MTQKDGIINAVEAAEKITELHDKGIIPTDEYNAWHRAEAKYLGSDNATLALYYKYVDGKPVERREPTEHERKQASLAYKRMVRTLKFQTLRETVLDKHEHTCFTCGVQFPERDTYEGEGNYPLMVKCIFPVVSYIQAIGITDTRELIKDEKIMNSDHYLPICVTCNPTGFLKNKK